MAWLTHEEEAVVVLKQRLGVAGVRLMSNVASERMKNSCRGNFFDLRWNCRQAIQKEA